MTKWLIKLSKRVEIYSNRFDKDDVRVFNWLNETFSLGSLTKFENVLPRETRLAKHVFGVMNKFRLRSRGFAA